MKRGREAEGERDPFKSREEREEGSRRKWEREKQEEGKKGKVLHTQG